MELPLRAVVEGIVDELRLGVTAADLDIYHAATSGLLGSCAWSTVSAQMRWRRPSRSAGGKSRAITQWVPGMSPLTSVSTTRVRSRGDAALSSRAMSPLPEIPRRVAGPDRADLARARAVFAPLSQAWLNARSQALSTTSAGHFSRASE